jgi:hypothetical protein
MYVCAWCELNVTVLDVMAACEYHWGCYERSNGRRVVVPDRESDIRALGPRLDAQVEEQAVEQELVRAAHVACAVPGALTVDEVAADHEQRSLRDPPGFPHDLVYVGVVFVYVIVTIISDANQLAREEDLDELAQVGVDVARDEHAVKVSDDLVTAFFVVHTLFLLLPLVEREREHFSVAQVHRLGAQSLS